MSAVMHGAAVSASQTRSSALRAAAAFVAATCASAWGVGDAARANEEPTRSWLIRAERVHTAAGETLENGFVWVREGKVAIVATTNPAPAGVETLEVGAITPGLIDLAVGYNLGTAALEQSTETPAHLRVQDALDLYDPRWERELKSGVTTVMAVPPELAVIGGRSVVLKTGGAPELGARLLKADAMLCATIGSLPSAGNRPPFGQANDFYSRRPTTRMAVEWELRKAFHDAALALQHPDRATQITPVLQQVLKGELPLRVQAWTTQDIRTAIFLKQEFGLPRVVIDAAAEAWKDVPMVVGSGAAVVLPPLSFTGREGPENAFQAWNTASLLHERGVIVALSGHGAEDASQRLAAQAGLAMRGGLPFDAALAAVTIHPARLAGVAERVGSLEAGKDADLVLWSGTPFEASSRVVGVLLDGVLVLDPRSDTP